MRVVSLLPSSTEVVAALGLGDRLVGRSHECDHPPEVTSLPACTRPKFEPDGTSYAVDERVRALVQEGLSVYRVDADRLAELRPDVILTQDQCEVCAADLGAVERAARDLLEGDVRVHSSSPTTLDEVLDDVAAVGRTLGAAERGEELARDLRARTKAVERRVGKATEGGATGSAGSVERPRVALVEWIDPLMAAGNWMPTLVEMAGGRPLFGTAGEHSPWLEWSSLREADPDVIVVVPCGFELERTRSELPALVGRPGWSELEAVRRGRVHLADGHRFFNRPGPRLVESLEILAEILHPELDFGHRGRHWAPADGSGERAADPPAERATEASEGACRT